MYGDSTFEYSNPAQQHQSFRTITTPSRRGASWYDNSNGMLERGFEGLYGGQENGDDEESWVAGVRFNNAGVRLWGARDAEADGRIMQQTPEREEWRLGRH